MSIFASAGFQGGWEVWLQCETFYKLPRNVRYQLAREVDYPGGPPYPRADIMIERADLTPPRLWTEMKVELGSAAQSVRDLVSRFADDVVKLEGLRARLPSATNRPVAIGVVCRNVVTLVDPALLAFFQNRSGVNAPEDIAALSRSTRSTLMLLFAGGGTSLEKMLSTPLPGKPSPR
jgi:hypothetical protein